MSSPNGKDNSGPARERYWYKHGKPSAKRHHKLSGAKRADKHGEVLRAAVRAAHRFNDVERLMRGPGQAYAVVLAASTALRIRGQKLREAYGLQVPWPKSKEDLWVLGGQRD